MHELNISSPLSLARFFLAQQLIYQNTKLKNKIIISLDIFVSDTSIVRKLHLPRERTFQLHKDSYSFLCTLDQILVFMLLRNKEHLRSGPYHHRGILSCAMINDWENNIACGENPGKARPWLLASVIRFMLYVNSSASNGSRAAATTRQQEPLFMFRKSISSS